MHRSGQGPGTVFISQVFPWGAVLGLAFLVSYFPIEDSNDAWWHLKSGKLLVEGNLGWYSNDPFTWSARDRVWINHEWLSQILFYLAYSSGGFHAAIFLKSTVILATFSIVFINCRSLGGDFAEKRSRIGAWALLATLLAIPTAQFTLYLRPPVFTFLLTAVFHWGWLRLCDKEFGWRTMLGGALLMVLWANLHGGAILGCVLIFLVWLGALLDRLKNEGSRTTASLRSWGILAGAIWVASLINPYGYHLHLLTFEMMSLKWVMDRLPELLPPPVSLIWTLPLLLIPALHGVARRGRWADVLTASFLIWQGLSHVRHLPLLAIWMAPYAAASLATKGSRSSGSLNLVHSLVLVAAFFAPLLEWILDPESRASVFRFPLALFLLVAAGIFRAFVVSRPVRLAHLAVCFLAIGFVVTVPGGRFEKVTGAMTGPGWSGKNYPDRLVDLIEKNELEGPVLFARETYTGFLIWRLAPESLRTFTCSRFDLQGGLPLKEMETMLWRFERSWIDPDTGARIPDWKSLWMEKYQFNLVLLEKFSDSPTGEPFPLWTYLASPESDFVLVASEDFPEPGNLEQEFTLFIRKGPKATRLMNELGGRLRFPM